MPLVEMAVAISCALFGLVLLMPAQHTHHVHRERHRALCVLCFTPGSSAALDLTDDTQLAPIKIDVFPAQAEQLTLPQATADRNVVQRGVAVRAPLVNRVEQG